jgi:Fe-S-cluster containining protein
MQAPAQSFCDQTAAQSMLNRKDRRRQSKEDEKLLVRGISPKATDAGPTVAMARQLHALLEKAKEESNLAPVITYLHSKVNSTLSDLRDIPVACKKGCAHCCHVWVSVTAPEAIYTSRRLRRKDSGVVDRIRAAHLQTKNFHFGTGTRPPMPCPLLSNDLCTIYDFRPIACRFAASENAAICERSYRLMGEDIPTPLPNLRLRGTYAVALACALRRATLPYAAYELNAALTRALEREDLEAAWLRGEDVFAGVLSEPGDLFQQAPAQTIYQYAFG